MLVFPLLRRLSMTIAWNRDSIDLIPDLSWFEEKLSRSGKPHSFNGRKEMLGKITEASCTRRPVILESMHKMRKM